MEDLMRDFNAFLIAPKRIIDGLVKSPILVILNGVKDL